MFCFGGRETFDLRDDGGAHQRVILDEQDHRVTAYRNPPMRE
jgi:hypothetical protein